MLTAVTAIKQLPILVLASLLKSGTVVDHGVDPVITQACAVRGEKGLTFRHRGQYKKTALNL